MRRSDGDLLGNQAQPMAVRGARGAPDVGFRPGTDVSIPALRADWFRGMDWSPRRMTRTEPEPAPPRCWRKVGGRIVRAAASALAAVLLVACRNSGGGGGVDLTEGSAFAYQDENGVLVLADATTGTFVRTDVRCLAPWTPEKEGPGARTMVAWTGENGGLFACVGREGELIVYRPAEGTAADVLPRGSCSADVRVSASGEFVSCVFGDRLAVRHVDGSFVADISGVDRYAWSAAGDSLIIRRAEPPARIYLLTPGGTALATLSGLADIGAVRWSPDGTRLAYASGASLTVVDTRSGRTKDLSLPWSMSELLGWSEDSQEVLVVPVGTGTSAVWSVNASTGEAEEVLTPADIWGPLLSANGRWLVFQSDDAVLLADLRDRSVRHLGEHPLPARREGAPAFRFDRPADYVCWVSAEAVTCDATVATKTVTQSRSPGDAPGVALARTSCTGQFAVRSGGTASEFFVVNDRGETVFRGRAHAGSEPLWLC